MMKNSMGCLWILASIGVISIAVKFFGEGSSSATIAGIAIFAVTVIAVTASNKK